MFKAVRGHLSPATALSIVAIVFAMSGGAFAASGGLGGSVGSHNDGAVASTAKKKKSKGKATGKTGPRGPKGETGPVGKEGPAGKEGKASAVPGPEGKEGPAGKEGKEGPAGKEGKEGPAGKEGKEGPAGKEGKEGKEGPQGSPASYPKTLPEGETETGTWSLSTADGRGAEHEVTIAIPFAIPVEGVENKVYVKNEEENLTQDHPLCPGNYSKPEAEPETICLYAASESTSPDEKEVTFRPGRSGVEDFGALIGFTSEGTEAWAVGSWAVRGS